MVAAGEPVPDTAELHAAEWFTWAEAFARIDEPALRRALAKADRRSDL